AAGFIGSHLVDALIAGGEPPIALDTPAAWARLRNLDGLTPRCDRIELDAAADVRPILAERRPRAIFHLSAFASVSASVRAPVKDYERNARATLYLLEAVRAASPESSVLFTSSAAVYGEGRGVPFREDDPVRPNAPYAVSKLAAERYLDLYARV